jgi:type I restriction enzyme S subunit
MARTSSLGDFVRVRTGKLDANAAHENGKYPFFTCSKEPLAINTYSFDCECVLLAGNGEFHVSYYSGPFDAYQRTYVIESLDVERLSVSYLYYFMRYYSAELRKLSVGGVIKFIKLGNIKDAPIPIPPISEQRRIVDLISRAEGIVRLRREAEKKAAELIPALFLDMFGDPAANPKGWPSAAIGDLFDVKGGKRLPKGAPYSEEPTALRYIRATDIKADRINERNLVFLFPEVQKSISRYVVAAEDVVITIAGTIGVAAPIGSSLSGVNLTENAAMIRPKNQARTNAIFFSSLMNSAFVQRQIEALTGRVTIGKLALERIRLIEIRLPPLPLQQEFGEKLAMVRSIQSQQSNATVKAKATFDALLTQAFSG